MPYVDMYEEDEEQGQNTGEEVDIDAVKQQANSIIFDHTLYNNFWLNEIKSLEDSSRFLMNMTFILSAAYVTIIAQNIDKITDASGMHDEGDLPVLFILLFAVPFCGWFLGIFASMKSQLSQSYNDVKLLIFEETAFTYLPFLSAIRRTMLAYSYILAFIPILYLSVITFGIFALVSRYILVVIANVFLIIIFLVFMRLRKDINNFDSRSKALEKSGLTLERQMRKLNELKSKLQF